MKSLLILAVIFIIYPELIRVKVVKADDDTPQNNIIRSISEEEEETTDLKGSSNKLNSYRRRRITLKDAKPIIVHAMNEWKRAKAVQGKSGVPKNDLYWGPHGLVKRSIDNYEEGKENSFALEKERPFDAVPTVFFQEENEGTYETPDDVPRFWFVPSNCHRNIIPYSNYETDSGNEDYSPYYNKFVSIKEYLRNWKGNQLYSKPQDSEYSETVPRASTLHSHGHTHVHQHIHSHGHSTLPSLHGHSTLPSLHGHALHVNQASSLHVNQASSLHGSHLFPTIHSTAGGFGHGKIVNTNIQVSHLSNIRNADSEQGDEVKLRSPNLIDIPFTGQGFMFYRSGENDHEDERKTRNRRSVALVKLAVDPNSKLDVYQTVDNMGTLVKTTLDDKTTPFYHVKDLTGSVRDTIISSTKVIPENLILPSRYKIIDTHRHNIVELPLSETADGPKEDTSFLGGINPEVYKIPPATSETGKTTPEPVKPSKMNISKKILLKKKTDHEMNNKSSWDPSSVNKTYQKVGTIIRNSVLSGTQTLSHLNDVIHSGRQIVHTTRVSAPRMLVPLTKVPALEKPPHLGGPAKPATFEDQVVVVAPKSSSLEENVGIPYTRKDAILGVGSIFDSVGITNPMKPDSGYAQSNFNLPGLKQKHYDLYPSLQQESEYDNLDNTLEALHETEERIGASSLHDFISKLKDDLRSTRDPLVSTEVYSNKLQSSKSREEEGDDMKNDNQSKLNNNLGTINFNEIDVEHNKIENPTSQSAKSEEKSEDEILQSAFFRSKDLLNPFMGKLSKHDLEILLNNTRHSLTNHSDSSRAKRNVDTVTKNKESPLTEDKKRDFLEEEPVLAAINPNLFQNYFNETMKTIEEHHRNPFLVNPDEQLEGENKEIGISFKDTMKYVLRHFIPSEELQNDIQKIFNLNTEQLKIYELQKLDPEEENQIFM